jgi:Rieske Fe-S protein
MWAGAPFRWRSQGQQDQNVLRGVVIRVRSEEYPRRVRDEFVYHGYLAALTHCTHLCCICGYRESETAREQGWFDWHLFCDCHGGVFDIRDVRVYHTPASARPAQAGVPVAPGPQGS